MDRFSEAMAVASNAPLRQGDVLEASDERASLWQRHLVVITADCDLAHDKNQGRVTCVPLLTAEEYLCHIHLKRRRVAATDALIQALSEALEGTRAANVSAERLLEWTLLESPETIMEDAGVAEGARSQVGALVSAVQRLSTAAPSLKVAADWLFEAQALHAPRPRPGLAKDLSGHVKNAFTSTPGDALFLSSIAPGLDLGYFAYLRHHEIVWETDIAVSPERVRREYRRIGRLRDRYIHNLVQRFATVFMTIGLPDAYESTRAVHADVMRETIN